MHKKNGHTVIELAVSVLLLIVLALLCANVYVMYLGKDYNDRVCRESIYAAGKAALDGKDTNAVLKAAKEGMYTCGFGGVFVHHPQFTAFSDDITSDLRVVKLQTQTVVQVPVEFLVFDETYKKKRCLVFTSTYYYQIKNPKKAQSKEADEKSN